VIVTATRHVMIPVQFFSFTESCTIHSLR